MAEVSRAGDTVRREAGFWTPRVQQLLAHLRAKGDPRMLANIEAGHLAIYLTDSIYVVQHAGELEAALAP